MEYRNDSANYICGFCLRCVGHMLFGRFCSVNECAAYWLWRFGLDFLWYYFCGARGKSRALVSCLWRWRSLALFLLALVLICIVFLILGKKREHAVEESVSTLHLQYIIGGFFAYLFSVFLSALLWFPSDERRLSLDSSALGMQVFYGTCLYIVGTIAALYLFYKASKGVIDNYPDLMRRVVLAVFAVLQFDKMPAFIAFLLIYSPETQMIYPSIAALALATYIPVSLFLLKLSWQSEVVD